nr:MAG TPA: hypothetical protein [Bacteriophage sp.]
MKTVKLSLLRQYRAKILKEYVFFKIKCNDYSERKYTIS